MSNYFKNAYKKSLCNKCTLSNMEAVTLISNLKLVRTVEVSTLTEYEDHSIKVDLSNFADWINGHWAHSLNWYINKRDAADIYNYELLKFYDVCKMYIFDCDIIHNLRDWKFYNNTNLNYTALILFNSIKNILDLKYYYDHLNYEKYKYLYDMITPRIKAIKATNKKYKICKI